MNFEPFDFDSFDEAMADDTIQDMIDSYDNVKVVDWEGGTHARGYTVSHLMGGFGARNRLNIYILFKFPRNKEN